MASDDVVRLTGADRVRKRPAVFFGSNGVDGVHRGLALLLDIFSLEATSGHGNKIIITLFLDSSVGIQDFGRGIYVGSGSVLDKEECASRFTELFAASKFHPELDLRPALFEDSGIGFMEPGGNSTLILCANQYVCEFMDVRINREGYAKHLLFKRGSPVGEPTVIPDDSIAGTYLCFRYDLEVFDEIVPSTRVVRELLHDLAARNKRVEYLLRVENESGFSEEIFYCP